MELIELYNNIQSPIDDLEVITKLIRAYANSAKVNGDFYSQLIKTVQKEHTQGQHYSKDADKFYAMMFNKWKNSILAMTREKFIELYKQGIYGEDFIEMRKYLKNIPDVATIKEANSVFFQNKGNEIIENALEKYSWTSFGKNSGWVHVCSAYVTANKDKYPNIEHRLYLNTESSDTYKMVTLLVKKCDEHHLPYYFKFDQCANRDDNIVIYSSTENLTKYIEILDEIKKENLELVSRTKEPPILTGKIDGWIGYGSEPSKTPDGKNHSFNEIRSDAIEPAISYITKKWIMVNKSKEIMYQNQKISFQNYVAIKATEKFILDLEHRFISDENYEKRVAQKAGKTYDQSTVINKLGYTLQDIRTPQVRQNIYGVINEKIETRLSQLCNNGYENVDPIKMSVRDGKQIAFTGYNLEQIIRELSVNIAKSDPYFILSIQAQIKIIARQFGIDINKFCFDTRISEKIKKISVQILAYQQLGNNHYNKTEITKEIKKR